MSAFDQAFIKAYKQQGSALKSVSLETVLSAPGANVEDDRPEVSAASTLAETKLSDVMAVLEKHSDRVAHSQTVAEAPCAAAEKQVAEKNETETTGQVPLPVKRKTADKSRQKRQKKAAPAPTLEELDLPEVIYRLDPPSPAVPQAPRTTSFTSSPSREEVSPQSSLNLPAAEQSEQAFNGLSTRRDDEQATMPTDAPAMGFHSQATIRVFQPMLQVDHLAWPKVCYRLETTAALELNRLTEALLNKNQQGMKLLAVGGIQRGEGATTLVLCAARRLVARSVKTVIIDADLTEPQLAKRLGLLPQLGWEEIAAGRQPVEEVLVESITDNLAILPLCGPFAIADISYAAQRLMAESLNTLRKNYDLVLMDLGPLENPRSFGDLTAGELHRAIDAVILVHNVGKTPAAGLLPVQHFLASVGVPVIGVIENFVRAPFMPRPTDS